MDKPATDQKIENTNKNPSTPLTVERSKWVRNSHYLGAYG
jgi:hypothetical protein